MGMFLACGGTMLTHEQYVDLTMCVMGHSDVSQASFRSWYFCSEMVGVNYSRLMRCMRKTDGDAASLEMKRKQAAVGEGYYGSPCVCLNGDCSGSLQDSL